MIGPAWAPGTRTSAAAKADASTSSRFTDLAGRAPVFGRHERIAVVGGRQERLLDRSRAYPTDEVPQRACLVVRAGSACAAERLLADDRAGRLVIDVEVAGRIAKLFVGEIDCVTLACEDRSSQSVWGAFVDQFERLAVFPFGVDVGRDDGAEELLPHRAEVGVGCLEHRRLDEVALRVVIAAAYEDFDLVRCLCLLD